MAGFRFSRFGASVALAALALAGCNRAAPDAQALLNNQSAAAAALPDLPATLPMTDAPAPPVTTAPRVAALPDARPIRAVRVRDAGSGAEYAYADAAYQFADALADLRAIVACQRLRRSAQLARHVTLIDDLMKS